MPPSPCHHPGGTSKVPEPSFVCAISVNHKNKHQAGGSWKQCLLLGGRYQPLCQHQHQFSCLLPTPLQTLKAKPQLLVSPQGRIYCHRLFRAVSKQGQGIPRARGVDTKRDEQRQLSCAKRLVHSFRKEGHLCKNVIFSICCFPM